MKRPPIEIPIEQMDTEEFRNSMVSAPQIMAGVLVANRINIFFTFMSANIMEHIQSHEPGVPISYPLEDIHKALDEMMEDVDNNLKAACDFHDFALSLIEPTERARVEEREAEIFSKVKVKLKATILDLISFCQTEIPIHGIYRR